MRTLWCLPLVLCVIGCGSSAKPAAPEPGKAYDKTFAGQTKCSPKESARPFIIDWDATDQSAFQAHAASDVVVVRYEGCALTVLDSCRDDSVKGSLGSYRSIDWTSGGLETMDIHDEAELHVKLPLGVAALEGRVKSGEDFHMEYYVSGTRSATRDKLHRGDLARIAGCAGATHFVYAYNLGAFALAAKSNLQGEAGGSYFGFGAGGSKSGTTKADKKGGDLAACHADTAKEVDACKAPIRLVLREITEGENPEAAAAKAPDTDASLNAAGKMKATSDAEKEAAEHLDSARQKKTARDGKGCVAELDAHDLLDPRPSGLSTNPKSYVTAVLRAECLMLAGQCTAGKDLFRKTYEAQYAVGADMTDKITDGIAATDGCPAGKK